MEPILDETTVVPDPCSTPAERILRLARLLRDLDQRGAMPVLRSVRDAKDRDVGGLRGLQSWCFAFSEQVDRDAGRLVALRLGKQPFIDGPGGLLARAEGGETIEARVGEQVAYGMAYAVLTDGIAVGLTCAGAGHNAMIGVEVLRAGDDELWSEHAEVLRLISSEDLEPWRGWIESRALICRDGLDLCRRATEMFPHLRFGALAREQLSTLAGGDPQLLQVLRHLRALDGGAREWLPDTPFSPRGSVRYSAESNATLEHKRLGKLRDFPSPDGFPAMRWSHHTKLAGGFRLYFHAQRADDEGSVVVLVGYVGPHLKTVRFK